jgi:hypothetical protein
MNFNETAEELLQEYSLRRNLFISYAELMKTTVACLERAYNEGYDAGQDSARPEGWRAEHEAKLNAIMAEVTAKVVQTSDILPIIHQTGPTLERIHITDLTAEETAKQTEAFIEHTNQSSSELPPIVPPNDECSSLDVIEYDVSDELGDDYDDYAEDEWSRADEYDDVTDRSLFEYSLDNDNY